MTFTDLEVSEIGELIRGVTFSKNEASKEPRNSTIPVLRSGNVQKNLLTDSGLLYIPINKPKERQLLQQGDIVISVSNSRELVGKSAIANNEWDGTFGAFLTTLRVDKEVANPKYIYYFMQTRRWLSEIASQSTATNNIANINNSRLGSLKIQVPSLKEQEKIVAKIEELFSEMEAADRSLENSKGDASFYKRLKKSQLVVDQDLSTLPLSEITERIQIGPFGSQLHKHDYIENGIPLINPANISDGKILPNLKKSITQEKYAELPMYHLAEGDVILGRRGEMGRSALVTAEESGWFCGTGSIFIRPDNKKIRSAYLSELLSSEYAIAYLESEAGGTTMSNLNKKILLNFPVPLPSLAKQDEMLLEIEALKTEISMMNAVISSSIKNSHSLKQSILSKAFKGELI
jgi:type I restriction enzyme S subunit